MKSNLKPEQRADKNGRVVTRHVKSDFVTPRNGAPSIPKPVATKNILQSVSLKEMDSGGLTLALISEIRELERNHDVDYDCIVNALQVATFLHRHQTRANRKNLPRTPYIEHPLRNTLRSIRWGCKDQDVIVAIVLHDTIEDCADDIVRYYVGHPRPESLSERQKREMSYQWLREEFGEEVYRLVHAVSNPLRESGANPTRAEKNVAYAEHVKEALEDEPKVFIVKCVDFMDNAAGLPHNNVKGNETMVFNLATKYDPVADIFEEALHKTEGIRDLVSEEGYAEIEAQLKDTKVRLREIIQQNQKP